MLLREVFPKKIFNILLRIRGKLGTNPYKEYNEKFKCIFIHVSKTGGSSFYESVFKTKRAHLDLKYFQAHDPVRFKEYFKFAFVRDPYSRLVSSYFYTTQVKDHNSVWVSRNLRAVNNFEEFVLKLSDGKFRNLVLQHNNFRNQHLFIEDLNGNCGLDFIGRFENLKEDYAWISNKLNITNPLIHKNVSAHGQYKQYYNKQTLAIVNKVYWKDFEVFGYPMVSSFEDGEVVEINRGLLN